jgi:hypothetical protein
VTGKRREDLLHAVRDPWACGVPAECERTFRGHEPQLPSLLSVGRVHRPVPGAGPAERDALHRGADCAPGPEGGEYFGSLCSGFRRQLGRKPSGERTWWWDDSGGRRSGPGFAQPIWAGAGHGVLCCDDSNGS